VLVLAVTALLCAAALAVAALGAAVLTRHRGALAADAAALAAAAQVSAGTSACAVARELAEGNGARLVRCRVTGAVVDVTVVVPPPRWATWLGHVRLNARAGPAETYPEKYAPVGLAS
jgi:secretion/DNA translocation related TadE-like protein